MLTRDWVCLTGEFTGWLCVRLLSKPEKNKLQSSYLGGPAEGYQKKKEREREGLVHS